MVGYLHASYLVSHSAIFKCAPYTPGARGGGGGVGWGVDGSFLGEPKVIS